MAKRDLPNVYASINDLSALVEGEDSLIVGGTLRAQRGPLGEAVNLQNSADLLNYFTFDGKIGAKQDATFHELVEILKVSSNVWVSRSANRPLFGGLIIKKEKEVGELKGVDGTKIYIDGNVANKVKVGQVIGIYGKDVANIKGRYGIKAIDGYSEQTKLTTLTLTGDPIEEKFEVNEDRVYGKIFLECEHEKLGEHAKINKLNGIIKDTDKFLFEGNVRDRIGVGDRFRINGLEAAFSTITDDIFVTVRDIEYNTVSGLTEVSFEEITFANNKYFYNVDMRGELTEITPVETAILTAGENGQFEIVNLDVKLFRIGLRDPEDFAFGPDDLFLITGVDQGAYNSKIGIKIISGKDDDLYTANAFKIIVMNAETEEEYEEYIVSMNMTQKAIDGTNIFIKNVINGVSNYIQIITPEEANIDEVETVPGTGDNNFIALGGGFDGFETTVDDDLDALEVFANKTVPVSILMNSSGANRTYQEALIGLCESRKDCFAFLKTSVVAEKSKLITQRIKDMVSYKTKTLSDGLNTSFYAAMYGPQVQVTDNFNNRKVTIGADAIAIRRWLQVIKEVDFPYAAAGPINGKITGATVNWKIGDDSDEAKSFNDNSMNVVVYEPRQKFYYFNTQNTLQLANSAFRNVGAVLNVLNIKENLVRNLKNYIQMPISKNLIESIIREVEGYMDGCKSKNRVSNYHLANNTTKIDISNNELHFVLTLSPAYYAQKIYLVMNVVNAAFDFEILQSK